MPFGTLKSAKKVPNHHGDQVSNATSDMSLLWGDALGEHECELDSCGDDSPSSTCDSRSSSCGLTQAPKHRFEVEEQPEKEPPENEGPSSPCLAANPGLKAGWQLENARVFSIIHAFAVVVQGYPAVV